MCDDLSATMAELKERGAEFEGEVTDQGWGHTIELKVPGAGTMTLYQPTYDPPATSLGVNGALPFDPIDEAARQWALHWEGVPQMHAVTSLMRVQQLVIGRLDALLKPLGLTFARYEALVLLTFSSRGSLPLGKMGERLQVHPTSVTSIVDRLERPGSSYDAGIRRTVEASSRRSPTPAAPWWTARPPSWSAPTSASGHSMTTACASCRRCFARSGSRPATSEGWLNVTDSEAVRRVALTLPRAYEVQVRGQWKFRVGQIVFVAFSKDEQEMGFGFPRAERDALVAAEPEKFFLPSKGDLRFQWVCARLPALDDDEMRELVVDAWRMCVRRCCTSCPSSRSRRLGCGTWSTSRNGGSCVCCCTPTSTSTTARPSSRGRINVMTHLADHPTPRPPTEVEIRDGQLYRWIRPAARRT